jgi:hypothetical protein
MTTEGDSELLTGAEAAVANFLFDRSQQNSRIKILSACHAAAVDFAGGSHQISN